MADLVALGQILPASELAKKKTKELKRAAEFDLAVESEISHRRTRVQSTIAPSTLVFKRESLEK